MAASRTLKLSILADVDDLRKKLNQGENDVQGFGNKLDGWSKAAGAAFLAAGAAAAAYAGKLAIDGVKAAIEDEAAQLKLATTLKNVTGATENQTKAVEDYILKTELAYGVTDDQLRPSLDRLVRSTKDVAEAQKLQTLALNIAAGTGKDLESVTNALAKAHDGQFTSLKKLGVSIDESVLKSKDFNAVTQVLASTFKDQASLQADTFDGKMRRLSVAFNEGKETVGGFILDAITPLIDNVVNKVIPALSDFAGGISTGLQPVVKIFKPILEGLTSAFNDIRDSFVDNKDKLQPFYDLIKGVAKFVVDVLAPVIGEVLGGAFKAFGKVISGLIDTFANIVDFFQNVYDKIKKIIDFLKNNPVSKFLGASYSSGGDTAAIVGASYSSGGSVGAPSLDRSIFKMTPEQQAAYEKNIAETARIRAQIEARARGEIFGSGNTVINVTGAIDPESVARQINDILTQSAARGGGATNLIYT